MRRLNISEARLKEYELYADACSGTFEPGVFGICDIDRNVLRCRLYGGELVDKEPDILIPEKLERLLFPKREKHVYGGRGSAKTRTVAAIFTEAIRYYNKRGVVFREFLENIRSSCYQEIVDEIDRRGMRGSQLKVTEKNISSMIGNGFTHFKGMHNNVAGIKGFASAEIAWLEEIENMSLMSWTTIVPTFRKSGSEIWSTFNPRFETDPSWTELIEPYVDKMVDGIYEDDDVLIISCNHSDNPWMTDELTNAMEKMKARDYDRYLWIWEGKFNRKSKEQVMNGKWIKEEFEADPNWAGPYFGADWGFSTDPSTLIKMWIDDVEEILYIEYEAYGHGVELDDIAKFFAGKDGANEEELDSWGPWDDEKWPGIPGSKDYYIWADNARPETISHVRKRDFRIDGAEKWPGSVEDGITFLRSFKRIVIHPRCVNTLNEAEMYKFKVDKLTEEILPDIVDAHNHCFDAIRYALSQQIRSIGSFFDV